MKKRVLSLILVLAMTVSMLTACGNGNSGKKDKEIITLTVFSELANYAGIQGGWSSVLLREKFGVELNIVPESEGTYETRVEAGNLGDIVVWGNDGDNYKRAVQKGLLYDWDEDDLIGTEGAYIKEHMAKALQNNRDINGGKLYGVANGVAAEDESGTAHAQFFYTWDLRWDLYKQLGYPEIKNMDDLYDVLVAMKEICPKDDNGNETYALSMWPDWDGDMVMYVKCIATTYFGLDGDTGLGHYNGETGEFYGALDDNSPYLQMLRWTNKLKRAGLIDPNSSNQTYNDMAEKLAAGGVFFSVFNYAGRDGYNTTEHLNDGKMMWSVCPTEATTPVYGVSPYGSNHIWSIGADTQYPEKCMEIINWLCTPEGAMTIWYGPKGLTWDYDEEGYVYLTELGELTTADSKYDMTKVEWKIGDNTYQLSGTFNDGCIQINNTTWERSSINLDSKHKETYVKEDWKTQVQKSFTPIQQDWVDKTGCQTTQQYFEKTNYAFLPATRNFVAPSKSKELETVWNQVTKCITDGSWNAIYAESEAEFDYIVKQMIKQAKAYGYDECLEFSKQTAAAKFAAQIK